MPAPSDTSVLIVGAGPTGLALAVELALQGVKLRVIDQAPAPSDRSKALVLQARTLEMFAWMGVIDTVLGRGQRTAALNMFIGRRLRLRIDITEIDSPYPFAFTLSQEETEKVLAERLAGLGIVTERRTTLTAFSQDESGVTAQLTRADGSSETVRAGWLAGCDGAHSTVRHVLGMPFEGARYEEAFMLADVAIDSPLPPGEGFGYIEMHRLIVALPMAGGIHRLIAMRAAGGAGGSETWEPTLADFQTLIDAMAHVPMKLHDPQWIAEFRLHRRLVPQMRQGRVFLAGDAAHIHSPAGGQGMNTGIQDAVNLAWKLALVNGGLAPPALLDSYQAERHPVAESVLRGTNLLFRSVTLRSRLLALLRNLLLPVIGLPALQRRIRGFISEIHISYRKSSPIVGEHRGSGRGFRGGPRPGDRAPDATLSTATGTTTLFDLLRNRRHLLLLFDGGNGDAGRAALKAAVEQLSADPLPLTGALVQRASRPIAATGDIEVFADPSGDTHRRYGADGSCLYLIRPDGYVAFRAMPAGVAALRAYLDRNFDGAPA